MEHPVTATRISSLLYWFFPLGIGVTQAVFNSYYQILPVGIATIDGLIFSLVLGVLGIAVWYVVRYNDPEKSGGIQILASHIAAALFFALLWIVSSGIIVKTILDNLSYNNYYENQFIVRTFVGLIFYAILVSFYYTYVYSQHNREKRLRETEWQNQIRKAQLSTLKSQINPHFLFNSLNSVASLTLTNPEKAHEMVIALSDFMRYSLRKHQDDMVTLDVELLNIRLYLQIEKIRFGSILQYKFDINEDCKNHLIPNLILQPLLENAIKYGVYEASKPVEILLTARKISNILEISLVNDFDPESVPLKGEGVGLKNIIDRLRLLYGSSTLLSFQRGENKFIVKMLVPDYSEIKHL